MPILNNPISVSGGGTSSDCNIARKNAGNKIVNEIFSKINSILSQNFTRVDNNTIEYDGVNSCSLRETYKLEDITREYLCVEITIPYSYPSSSANYLLIKFIGTNNIISSNDAITGYEFSAELNVKSAITEGSYVKDDVNYYSFYISCNFNILTLKNDNFTIYTLSKGINKESFCNSIGMCKIGNDSYFVYSYSDNLAKVFKLFDSIGNQWYTNSVLLHDHLGVNDSNLILTLPIYLTDENSRTGAIFADLILETSLQTTSISCSCGSTYKINGVEYFALGDNFLVKL